MIDIKVKRIKLMFKALIVTFLLMLFAREASSADMKQILRHAAAAAEIPPSLLIGVCITESKLNPKAFNKRDPSYGLCQIMHPTAQQMGFAGKASDLFDPAINAKYAAKYLQWQLRRYSGSWIAAIAAYNAGSLLRDFRGQIVNIRYVDKVIKNIGGYCGY